MLIFSRLVDRAHGRVIGVSPVLAVSIGFAPSSTSILPGEEAWIDVVVSGLEEGGLDEIVSAFDLDVSYDASVLSATGVTFGPGLGDPFFFEVLENFDLSVAGIVDFASLSFLGDATLAGMQGDSVTLATLHFEGIGVGWSDLTFVSDPIFGIDVKGRNATILDLNVNNGSLHVASAPVPEPSTYLLLGTGLIGLAFLRKRQLASSETV